MRGRLRWQPARPRRWRAEVRWNGLTWEGIGATEPAASTDAVSASVLYVEPERALWLATVVRDALARDGATVWMH